MKYIVIAVAAFFMCSASSCWAEVKVDKKAEIKKQVVEQKHAAVDGIKPKEIDLSGPEDSDGVEPAVGYGEGDRRVMPTWKDEDYNTGLPDRVESDVEGGIQ